MGHLNTNRVVIKTLYRKASYLALFGRVSFTLGTLAALQTVSGCKIFNDSSQASSSATVTTVSGTVTNNSSASSTTATTVTFTPGSGTAYSSFTVDLGSGYQATNVCSTATIFGLQGTASCSVAGTSTVVTNYTILQSNALRNITSTQITQAAEAGTAPSSSLPTGYRDTPDSLIDDEGGYFIGYCASSTATTQAACTALGGTFTWISSICVETGGAYQNSTGCTGGSRTWVSNGSGCTNLTPGANSTTCSTSYPIMASTHANFSDCGGNAFANIAASVANCASVNGAQATWNGAVLGGHGEASWVMVAHKGGAGSNKEVWQDQRTGLLWSSAYTAGDTWCKAAGSVQVPANGGSSCGGNTISYCAENTGMTPGFAGDTGGAWQNTGRTYDNAKGGMGLQSALPVRWRLPTKNDYVQAEVDGIRYVMPDMGFNGTDEWSATVSAQGRSFAWEFMGNGGIPYVNARTNFYTVRCVGRGP